MLRLPQYINQEFIGKGTLPEVNKINQSPYFAQLMELAVTEANKIQAGGHPSIEVDQGKSFCHLYTN